MQQYIKAFAIGVIGTAATVLVTFSLIQVTTPKAEATPAIGQGKPCNACHTSGSPSKTDVKK
jgi:hypothetical protein